VRKFAKIFEILQKTYKSDVFSAKKVSDLSEKKRSFCDIFTVRQRHQK